MFFVTTQTPLGRPDTPDAASFGLLRAHEYPEFHPGFTVSRPPGLILDLAVLTETLKADCCREKRGAWQDRLLQMGPLARHTLCAHQEPGRPCMTVLKSTSLLPLVVLITISPAGSMGQ